MKVRFKNGVSDNEFRISYDLESNTPSVEYDEVQERYCLCYRLKLLGFVWADILEVAEEKDLPAIDVMLKINAG